ncbi:unnamed protein product [Trifolium pratense]|uniref:Uncharacterized protein n=1 Tax=Trifolium pratense TaxID=57577 RepID=A0ACB0LGQ0_TRIPR|nr:unnamed protein product [Trifolium pratense]
MHEDVHNNQLGVIHGRPCRTPNRLRISSFSFGKDIVFRDYERPVVVCFLWPFVCCSLGSLLLCLCVCWDHNHKVEGESEVTVISNSNGSVDKTTIVDVVEREGEIYQNGSGSDVNHVHVTDNTVVEVQNGALDKESSECAVESSEDEIRDEVSDSVVEEGVKVQDRELESFENGVVEENEICDVVADVDKSDRELEGGVVENGVVDTGGGDVEEIEVPVPVVVEEVAAASTEAAEAGDSDVVGTAESKDHESVESEKVGGVGVDTSGEKTEICDVELESEVGAEVSDSAENKLESVVDAEVSESAEKNEIGDVELESNKLWKFLVN